MSGSQATRPSAPARRSGFAPFLLTSIGGLLLAGGGSADWVREEVVREVAGVPLTEVITTAGTAIAPETLATGVAALLLGLVLLMVRGAGRRWLGLVVLVTGVAATASVAVRTVEAAGRSGAVAEGPAVAGIGALAILTGGLAAVRTPSARPGLSSRYAIDEQDGGGEADEWHAASVEPNDDQGVNPRS